jgi:radical SAM-linked protein
VGFSLQYELSYTSVLNMLELGGIPRRAAERGREHPVVIAGGPCTVNPLPMAPFMDAFLVGDGEEAVVEIVDTVYKWKSEGDGKRDSLLRALAGIEGVFVPSVSSGVRRRIIPSLEDAPYPTAPIVPYTEIVHDRVNVEVSRGCTMGCRFCQAGMIYRPLRERSPQKVLELVEQSIKATGYEEVAFTSLSAGDYSCLLPLLRNFNRRFEGKMIGISLPSLRVKAVNEDVLREIRTVRKTGFTIAPEAATGRLRNVINKDFSEEDYDQAVEMLFKAGWQNLKLYFMLGLPGEREEDIEAIAEMVKKTLRTAKRHTSRYVNISVSLSPFVPKTHTPFQWVAQADMASIREKKILLSRRLRKIKLRGHDEKMSLLEAAFARGDERISGLVEAEREEGARLDGWTEAFDFDAWVRAMDKTGMDAADYARREYDVEGPLPWDIIDIGVNKEFLKREYERARDCAVTEDCRVSCTACGLECEESEATPEMVEKAGRQIQEATRKPVRMRVEFSKTGTMRHLSHRELMTHITRALRRAGVQLEHSKGFHPNPKIAFGPPLGVGVAGLKEYFDMEVIPAMAIALLRDRINSCLAEGVRINEIVPIGLNGGSLQGFISKYVYEILSPEPGCAGRFMGQDKVLVERNRGQVDLREMVEQAVETEHGKVILTVRDIDSGKVRLDEITTAVFGKKVWQLDITRVSMHGYKRGMWTPPLEGKDRWQAAS